MGITLVILAATSSVALAMVAVFPVGMAGIAYVTATTTIVQMDSRQDMHGRVLALQTVLIGGPLAVGRPFLGWLADALGGRAPLILCGVAALAAAGHWLRRGSTSFGRGNRRRTMAGSLRRSAITSSHWWPRRPDS